MAPAGDVANYVFKMIGGLNPPISFQLTGIFISSCDIFITSTLCISDYDLTFLTTSPCNSGITNQNL